MVHYTMMHDRLAWNMFHRSLKMSIVVTAIAVSIVSVRMVVVAVRIRSVWVLDNCALVVGLLKIEMASILGLQESVVLILIPCFLTLCNFMLICRLSALGHNLSRDKVLTMMKLMRDIRLHL